VNANVPEIHISQAQLQPEQEPPSGQRPAEESAIRRFLLSRGNSAIADRGFSWLMLLCALSIFGIVVLIAAELVQRSHLAWSNFGFDFFFSRFNNPITGTAKLLGPGKRALQRPALHLWHAGLVVSGSFAGGSLAIGVAVYLTEMCPQVLRGPLAFLTELLAAHSQRDLWFMGDVHPGAAAQGACEPAADSRVGLDRLFATDNPTGSVFLLRA